MMSRTLHQFTSNSLSDYSGINKNENCMSLKPIHTIGKVSVNASILYTNQEICNKTNL